MRFDGIKTSLAARLVLGAVLGALLSSGTALALDPRKALSQYRVDVWKQREGLPQDMVKAVVQTRDGYIWLGTAGGLARFDGVRFVKFNKRNTPEIQDEEIVTLLEDHEDSLWIGTYAGGILRYQKGKFTSYTTKEGLPHNSIFSIYEDSQRNLWIGTVRGLCRFKDGKFIIYTTANGLTNDSVTSIYQDWQGTLWIGTRGGGLNRMMNGRFFAYPLELENSRVTVSSIIGDAQHNLWIATFEGLVRLKDGQQTVYTDKTGLSDNSLATLHVDREGALWIGSYGGGVSRYYQGKFEHLSKNADSSNRVVYSICEDHEGSVWIGTESNGLNRLRDVAFTSYTAAQGLSSGFVYSVAEDQAGTLWIGTKKGLNSFGNGGFLHYTSKEGLEANQARSVFCDSKGIVWVGTNHGLYRFKSGKLVLYTSKEGLSGNDVVVIFEDTKKNLWIGTNDRGLNRFSNGKFTRYTTEEGLSDNTIRAICEDRQGNIWVGTRYGGLNRLSAAGIVKISTAEGLSSKWVLSLYADAENLWVGTRGGGLNRLRDGKISVFTTRDGLYADSLISILEDARGNLWMSSPEGIFRVNKKDLNQFAEKKVRSINLVSYGVDDGMPSSTSVGGSQPGALRARNGTLWFANINGLVTVDPEQLQINSQPPPVLIEQVLIDGESIDLNQKSRLAPGKQRFEFQYAGLSYLSPQKVRFKYKLEGSDNDWIDAGNRRAAFYTHLSPGSYRFRVKASNNDGVWNEAGAVFDFYLQPHFYQTYLFYGLCGSVIIFAGLALYHFRVARLKANKLELIRLVDQRTAQLQQEIEERKQSQEAQRVSEEKFSHAFRLNPESLTLCTLDGGRFVEVNDNFLRLTELKREEVSGHSAFELNIWGDPADPTSLDLSLREQGRVKDREILIRAKSGDVRTVLFSAEVITIRGEKHVLAAIADITERKRLEQQLRQAQKMEAVGKLAGGVAHDLNNMLTIITGYSNLLLDDYRSDDPSRAQVENIKKAAERSASLTHQLLAFSRKQYLAPVVLNLNTFITGLERGIRALIGDGISLRMELSPDLGQVSTDPAQLELVVMNLVANARDAMPNGGRLAIETRNTRLDASYALEHPEVSPGAYAMMEVTDTGIGMDKETLSRLFEPFFTTKQFGGGSGLGLSTAYGIIKQSKGHIEVNSTVGVGSTFRIYLSLVEPVSPVQEPDRSSQQDKKDVETVLLVEDDKGIRRLAVRVLQARGYKVLEAEDDLAALRIAREYSGPVHLLVTSELLPEMSGPQLAQQLTLLFRDLKVLYLSNSELDAWDPQGEARGVAFLQKPFTPSALTRRVRTVLDSLRIDD